MVRAKNKTTKQRASKTSEAYPRRWPIKRLVVLAVGLILVSVGLNAVGRWYNLRHAGVPASHTVATTSSDKPSEQPVPSSYSVPADKPLSIELPTIRAKGFIQQVGVDGKNQIVAPGNVHMAGWYTGSVLPGDNGLSIIDGHVNGVYAKGVFANLAKLKTGDSFTVTFGNKHTKSFKVTDKKIVTTEAANTVLYERSNSIASQLNLVTCGGRYDKATRTYDQRVIVVATATD